MLYSIATHEVKGFLKKSEKVEMPGIEPGASHMRSERSTTELHPPSCVGLPILY